MGRSQRIRGRISRLFGSDVRVFQTEYGLVQHRHTVYQPLIWRTVHPTLFVAVLVSLLQKQSFQKGEIYVLFRLPNIDLFGIVFQRGNSRSTG